MGAKGRHNEKKPKQAKQNLDACGVPLAMTLHPKIQTDHESKQRQQNRHRDEVWSDGVHIGTAQCRLTSNGPHIGRVRKRHSQGIMLSTMLVHSCL